ncbi:MAG: nucleotidyltransferase domain-containing protein [Clostridia bacterium]|nr:nucleotidyltransferase domain-containing protein [Clostridia bacterium]
MERLNLVKCRDSDVVYSRTTAKKTLDNVIIKIKEANERKDFIYRITKVVLFGSYINSTKEKIGDLDLAIYVELKDKSIPEIEQNQIRAREKCYGLPTILQFIYGKEEVFRFIKDRKRILELHDGIMVDYESKKRNEPTSYIYFDKYKIIYEEAKENGR